jgi:hypothetical protein
MTTRNVELLEATMQYILDHPEEWDQSTFICGTAACFAGRAALLSGWSIEEIHNAADSCEMYSEGAKLLGLTYVEAHCLFRSENTVPALELMVKDLVNGDELQPRLSYHS